ncbi:unnamed protein product [Pylaiella littoralis]
MPQLYPHRATLEEAETEIFKLLSYGATPKQWAEWLRAPLEHAAARGNFDLVDRLLKAGANGSAGWRGCRGRTLLDAAALGGNGDVVSALLRAGCGPDVNVVSVSSKRSALHLSAVCGHETAARKLMLAGAEVNHKDAADKCGPLHIAAAGGHKDLVSDLLIGGACPNARDVYGRTPLHSAAMLGHSSIVSMLLGTASTDKNALDNALVSPLMMASERGHLSIVKALLVDGADIRAQTSDSHQNMSVLDLAAIKGHVEVTNAIIEHGGDVNKGSPELGFVPLHYAAEFDRAGVVDVLLDSGANVGVKDRVGSTPLHLAALHSSHKAMLALLRQGANVNEAGSRGCTPLHWVCMHQRPGLEASADLLLRWGASETAVDDIGKTPTEVLESRSANRRGCSAEEAEHVRVLLARAPADRIWRRRCWPIMLRARVERGRTVNSSDGGRSSGSGQSDRKVFGDREVGGADGGEGRVRDEGVAGALGIEKAAEEGYLIRMVALLVGLQSHEVFCRIIGYLQSRAMASSVTGWRIHRPNVRDWMLCCSAAARHHGSEVGVVGTAASINERDCDAVFVLVGGCAALVAV